jgi:hypothetical protein
LNTISQPSIQKEAVLIFDWGGGIINLLGSGLSMKWKLLNTRGTKGSCILGVRRNKCHWGFPAQIASGWVCKALTRVISVILLSENEGGEPYNAFEGCHWSNELLCARGITANRSKAYLRRLERLIIFQRW